MNITNINTAIKNKFITKRKHPKHDIWVYNYTANATYKSNWTPEILACRGLVMDKQNKVLARPFTKFFNYEELLNRDCLPNIPSGKFETYDKMDGSLGIVFYYNNEWMISTRGSFESEQAINGNKILHEYDLSQMDKLYTYCFEIIYPQNRIVVDYGNESKLTLLGIIETQTGIEKEYHDMWLESKYIKCDIVKKYNFASITKMLEFMDTYNGDLQEGFIAKWPDGFRMKIKYKDYCLLHHTMFNISPRSIWKSLSENRYDDIIHNVPDEMYDMIDGIANKLKKEYQRIMIQSSFNLVILSKQIYSNRAEWYATLKSLPHYGITYSMIQKNDYEYDIWQRIKPDHDPEFSRNIIPHGHHKKTLSKVD